MKTGTADLPLHTGRCPRWLFKRMSSLSSAIAEAIIEEYSQEEFLKRLSEPFWFQAFGCVLGFDWHSSGLTTTVMGALKASLDPEKAGIAVLGGKGKASRKTQEEIDRLGETFSFSSKKEESLKHASRLSAKIDSCCVQDGYELYHHSFIVSEKGKWAVIQQGMNSSNRYARRYHWLSEEIKSFVEEPHSGIVSEGAVRKVLNMVSRESRNARKVSVDLACSSPSEIKRLFAGQSSLLHFSKTISRLSMPRRHSIPDAGKINIKTLEAAYQLQPKNYEELLAVPGMGAKTVRALALVSEIIYGEPPSWKDPARFSFAHGGKDRIPYPVDRQTYDRSIEILKTAVEEARTGKREKLAAVKRLERFWST